jgi:hypothetical protein
MLSAHDPVYSRVGERFLAALTAAGRDLRHATMENAQAALEVMRSKEDGAAVRPATVNTCVTVVKSFLGFAHRVGITASMRDRSSSSRRRRAKLPSAC